MKNSLFLILLSLLVNIIAVNVDGRIIRKRNRKNVMNMNHPYSKYPSNNPWNKKPSYPSNNPWNKKPSYPSNNPWNKKPSFPSNNPWMHNWNKTHDNAETPHTEPETPHTEPETPHTEPETPHTEPETPHTEPACVVEILDYKSCELCCVLAYTPDRVSCLNASATAADTAACWDVYNKAFAPCQGACKERFP